MITLVPNYQKTVITTPHVKDEDLMQLSTDLMFKEVKNLKFMNLSNKRFFTLDEKGEVLLEPIDNPEIPIVEDINKLI